MNLSVPASSPFLLLHWLQRKVPQMKITMNSIITGNAWTLFLNQTTWESHPREVAVPSMPGCAVTCLQPLLFQQEAKHDAELYTRLQRGSSATIDILCPLFSVLLIYLLWALLIYSPQEDFVACLCFGLSLAAGDTLGMSPIGHQSLEPLG